jgi:hypothetical protein
MGYRITALQPRQSQIVPIREFVHTESSGL